MKQGLKRFRRMATACAAGTIALSVISVLGFSSVASAAVVSPPGSSITAATAPNIAPTAINSPAGNLSFNIAAGTTWTGGSVLNVSVADHAANPATIKFAGAPTVTANTGAGDQALCGTGIFACIVVGTGTNTLSVLLTGAVPQSTPTATPESLVISGIGYTTTAAVTGFVTITTTLANFATGSAAANAVVATPPTMNLIGDAAPVIPPGATTPAGPQELFLSGNNSTWAVGDKVYITVARNDGLNCETVGHPDSVGFAGTPTATATAQGGAATTVPTLTAAFQTGAGSSCASFSGVNNVMVLTFTNTGSIILPVANAIDITIAGVSYTVSADIGSPPAPYSNTNNLGNVSMGASYNVLPTYATSGLAPVVPFDKLATPAFSNLGPITGPANANININQLVVTANVPATVISFNATATGSEAVNKPISPISIKEGTPGALSSGVTGFACIALNPGAGVGAAAEFNGTPTLAATGGGIVVGAPTLVTPGGQTGPSELAFQVTTASSGTPGTVTLSNISLNVPTFAGFTAVAALWTGAQSIADACLGANTGGAPSGTAYANNPFTIANVAARIFGQVQDDTAAQVFHQFPPVCTPGIFPFTAQTPAVLVTNQSYQDALSASYLAGQLHTGILTTPQATVSPAALQALRDQGVTEVFVVGGPLAVSQANVTQLQNTPAYNCGGLTQRTNVTGNPVDLTVQWIFGANADATAAAVATYTGAGIPGTGAFPGAYGGPTNTTSGSSGTPVSGAPDTNVTTAILATNQSFTDAASASVVAYQNHFPLILTGQASLSPEANAALVNDSIQQVIVMGGPIAISDNVLTSVEALGITVLRVAGQDFTESSTLLGAFELNTTVPLGMPNAGLANGLGWDSDTSIKIARGDYYTDAIVASGIHTSNPILLTWDPNTTGNPSGVDYLGAFLHTLGQTPGENGEPVDVDNLLFVGGPFAISSALATAIGHDIYG
jgi:putative cell wall-binding protein